MEMKGLELCRDPTWMRDAVSKFLESPVYSIPLLDFIDENCGMFEDSEDNKLEYTIVHENFKELVDGLISDFLNSLGISIPTFVQMLANEVHSSLYSIVVTSILTVDDFLLFKEMMLKRNFQISNQILNEVKNHPQELEKPADVHSVIDHLSDVSKQKHNDREAAKSLSLVDAFQQQAKLLHKDIATKPRPTINYFNPATKEEEKYEGRHEDHIELYSQCKKKDYEYKKDDILKPHLKEDFKEVVEPPCTSDGSFNKEESREPSISLLSELNTQKFEEDNFKCDKSYALEQKTTFIEMISKNAPSAKDNGKENTRITKVSFGSPCKALLLEEVEEKPFPYKEEFTYDFDEVNCINDEMEECKKEEDAKLTTSNKMLEDLIPDVNQWRPKSLKLNTNDCEIQQRKRYLQQQRDRILAHKKSTREKQIRFFRQLESKSDTIPRKSRRVTMPMSTLPHNIEANRKREALRKELARCLKEELTNKSSNMSTTSKQIQV